MTNRAVVIGGGFGGLAAALCLQSSGVPTVLVEKEPVLGGKARNLEVAGRPVPTGPTVLTLRSVFDALFAAAGQRLDEHVTIRPLDILAHHRWSHSERLDLYRDVDQSAAAIEAFAGKSEADGYRRFVADAKRIFETVDEPFIRAPKPDIFRLAKAVGPLGAHKIKPFDNMWSAVGRHFRDPRLHQLFGRYATYCGSSPFAAPATLMLVAHAEQRGVYAIEGGTAALAEAMGALFVRLGGAVKAGVDALEIIVSGGAVRGVRTQGAGTVKADIVVFNGDVSALGSGLLGANAARATPAIPPKLRTLSAVTFCGGAVAQEPLGYHTVAFSADYPAEFDALFAKRTMPDAPTVYICSPDPPEGGEGSQRVLIVMNAPADGDTTTFHEEDIARCQNQAMATLSRCGLSMTLDEVTTTTPADFHQRLPGTGGAIYGRVSHGWTASFQRAAPRTKIRGLYLAGGSAHPGPGVPMATLSGQIAVRCILKDFGSTILSRQAATSGGMSTG